MFSDITDIQKHDILQIISIATWVILGYSYMTSAKKASIHIHYI